MSDIMCENCGKKKAIVHVAALMGDKKVDKWLCEDCAKDFLPFAGGELPLSPELAKNFFDELLKGKKPEPEVSKDGFSLRASKIVSEAIVKAIDMGSDHMGTEHINCFNDSFAYDSGSTQGKTILGNFRFRFLTF